MKTKHFLCILLAAVLMCALAACNSDSASNLTGTPEEILEKLVGDAKTAVEAAGGFYYISMASEVTADTSLGVIGFSSANFDKYVTAASCSKAGIGSQAYEIILIQCKDAKAAKEVKKLVKRAPDETDGGYNSMKWICVWPEKCAVVESGSYVLVAASLNNIVDAALDVFRDMAGSVGEIDVFYEHIEE